MKKFLLASLLFGAMSVNLSAAWLGTIDSVSASSDGSAYVTLKRTSDSLKIGIRTSSSATVDGKKMLLTVALTAQSTGKSVVAWADGTGWTAFKMIEP